MLKKLGVLALSSSILAASVIPVYATETKDISVFINGQQISFDVQPQIINDSTFVPMRQIFETLEADVQWNDADKSITAVKDDKTIILKIGDTEVSINGEKTDKGIAPLISDGRTLVPLRMVSELLDCDVQWDGETKRIDITKIEDSSEDVKTETKTEDESTSTETEKTYAEADYVSITDNSSYILLGNTVSLNLKTKPFDIPIEDLQVTSSDESILKVNDDNTITAVGLGKATITVTSANGKYSSKEIEASEFVFNDYDDEITIGKPIGLKIDSTTSTFKKVGDNYDIMITLHGMRSVNANIVDGECILYWEIVGDDGFSYENGEVKFDIGHYDLGESLEVDIRVRDLPAGEYRIKFPSAEYSFTLAE